jgi:serine/threonine protein kinase/tetratricopeptide (TPR) repeat protein
MAVFQGTNRYVVLRYLGSGSFGEVYEVYDRERQTKIALKIPHEATASGLYYFKREFRSLIDVTHPNLAALYDLVGDQDHWFFTMELVNGIHFKDYLRTIAFQSGQARPAGTSVTEFADSRSISGRWNLPDNHQTATGICLELNHEPLPEKPGELDASTCSPPPDYPAVRALLRQLAEGLNALHRAGKLHRDIKPSNVLVTPEGHLTILDFGLVVEVTHGAGDDHHAKHLIGTPAYMSPEQLNGHRGTEASDWYSVGIMLYEVLTGHQPFSGSLLEIMKRKIEQDPAAPSSLVLGTPLDLDALCMQLLRREAVARPKGSDVLERLKGFPTAAPPTVAIPASSSLPMLVGRVRELSELIDAFTDCQSGRPRMVKLHGGSGTGKTLLLRHFVQELNVRESKAVILQGRCYEQESVPYKAMDPLIDDLSRHLSHLPQEQVEWLVPRHALALTRLFPVLNRIDALTRNGSQAMDLEDAKAVRRRAILALRELLGRLTDQHPVVLIIDDLHWGDLDSAYLIRELLSPPEPPPVLLVMCYRSEEASSAPVLMELLSKPTGASVIDIPLKELSLRFAETLAITLIGAETPEANRVAKRIARDSGGNPFFIGELAHHSQSGLSKPSDLLENTLYGCIQQRVASLPAETQRIVEILALAGHPLSWEVVKKTSGIEGAKLPPASLLQAGRLIRTRSTHDLHALEIYHDFVRRAVLSTLSGNSRRSGHLRLAEILEAFGEGEPEILARHYILAGESRKASDFTARAGDKAFAAFAFKGAADLYRRSIELRPVNDPENPELQLRLANALSSAGLGKEAAEIYLQLASILVAQDRLPLQRRAAEELFRSGHFDQGVETLKPILAAIGMRIPARTIIARIFAAYYAMRLRLRGLGFSERTASDIAPEELEQVDICWTAVQGLGTGALMRGMDMQVRHLLLALKVGEPSRIIRALAHQTLLESMQGNRSLPRTQRYQLVSLALAEKHGDPKLTGYAHMTAGIAAMMQGRWDFSVSHLEQARTIYSEQCVGVVSELHQVNHHLLSAFFVQGNFRELDKRHPALLSDAEERGDLLAEANLKTGYSLFHHLAKDDPHSAQTQLARALEIWSSKEFHSQHWQALILQGAIHLYTGHPEAAWKILIRQWKDLQASRLLDVQYVRISCHEHRARTALAFARTCSAQSSNLRLALKVARASIQSIRKEKIEYGYATYLKLRGMEAAICGRKREAIEWLHRAELKYETIPMPLHANVVRWCRGKLLGQPGTMLVDQAEMWMRYQGIVHPGRYATAHVPCVDPD